MSREIKFRAWDGKQMFYNVQELYDGMGNITDRYGKEIGIYNIQRLCIESFGQLLEEPHIKVMQYTGVQDKNGGDVYEGDIVKSPKKSGGYRIAPVVLHHGHFMLTKSTTGSKWRSWGHTRNKDKVLMVGNIYENKEFIR